MKELLENNEFVEGIAVGVSLYQNVVLAAHERKEPLKIVNDLYFVQSSREKLVQVLDEMCK